MAMLVKQKIMESGIDIEAMLAGPAGAARLAALSPILGDPQGAGRFLRAQMGAEDLADIGLGADAKEFDNNIGAIMPQSKQVEALAENMAVTLLKKLGIGLGETGVVMDALLKDLSMQFADASRTAMEGKAFESVKKTIADKVKDIFGVALGETVSTTPPPEAKANDFTKVIEDTSAAADSLKLSAEALKRLVEILEEEKAGTGGEAKPGDSSSAGALGSGAEVVLTVDPSLRSGVIKVVNDAFRGKLS